MVSFSCENCGDVLTKKKLDPHRNQCYGASYTCLDCMVHFPGTEYRSHTSCISEAQKYQGHLYKEKEKKGKPQPAKAATSDQEKASFPRKAYVEDEAEGKPGAVAVPRAPPVADDLPANVNVFDYLVTGDSQHSQHHTPTNGESSSLQGPGYSYGNAPLESTHDPNATPAPRHENHKGEKSDKKRKRIQMDEPDASSAPRSQDRAMEDAPPVLHSGLTGGLNRLLSRSDDSYQSRHGAAESPTKRSKNNKSDRRREEQQAARREDADQDEYNQRQRNARHRRDSSSEDERSRPSRKQIKVTQYRVGSAEPSKKSQLVVLSSPADLFLSFITKGPESEKGVSINKALKRYHRERGLRGDKEKEDGDKELWKHLRVRRNDKGEYVLFA